VTRYDAIGVMILPCRKPGKFKACRVAIKDGQPVVLQELTENRVMSFAHKEARLDFELLLTDLARGKVELTVPEQLTLKFE
jgi:hypothetical protein